MALSDITTRQLEILVEAACRYGVVLDLLSVIHMLRNGRELGSADADLLDAASVAALIAKLERVNQGIDIE
ncbi:MAG: hypothetical protein JWM42_1110 [Burkholderia sp.]|jgi:hypothetical protein|nr:hypothetical protein [Burkholderia sp.]